MEEGRSEGRAKWHLLSLGFFFIFLFRLAFFNSWDATVDRICVHFDFPLLGLAFILSDWLHLSANGSSLYFLCVTSWHWHGF